MELNAPAVDHVLSTTRAVRLRLDLERPVDPQILLDCIDIAEQAPTGGNQGSRRWLIVRDEAKKAALAELYRDVAGQFMISARDRLAGSGHPNERVMRSAAHLAEHLAEVPAIVIPTIIGEHDGSGRPGLFDSVLQSAWSFCLALRARGLGTAWTTAGLARSNEIAALLGIPAGMTQIAIIPVAWTKGTEFKAARRFPAREIAFFDAYAHTWERGPSDPPCHADGPGTVVELDIDAKPEDVWPYVTDLSFGAQFSEEFQGANWAEHGEPFLEGATEPAVGAEFIGTNQHPAIGTWDVSCFVSHYEPHRTFGWVTSDPANPGAQWRLDLEPIAGRTRLRYRMVIGPGPSGISAAIAAMPEKEPRILSRRLDEHRGNMTRVIEGIRSAVEGTPESGGVR